MGVGLAYAGVRFLVAIGPSNLPRLNEIAIDARTLGFTFVLSMLSGLLFGLIPALKYARPAHWLGSAERRANDQREPGAASGAEFAGGWTGGDGAGAFDERWLDDSHIRGIAKGRSGIC